jgi:hypothetical protein
MKSRLRIPQNDFFFRVKTLKRFMCDWNFRNKEILVLYNCAMNSYRVT